MEAPNLTLSFWNPEEDGEEFVPNVAGFALRVPDVAAARRELEAKGVEFLGETFDSGVCHMGFFKDPDGNTVILHRRYAPHGQGRAPGALPPAAAAVHGTRPLALDGPEGLRPGRVPAGR